MASDSISASSSPSVPNCRDFSRKKRRAAKLKQCKLDARREQWLSQVAVKKKGCKEETDCDSKQACREKERSIAGSDMGRRGEENGDRSIQHESDSDSPSNSPTSVLLGGVGTGTNFIHSGSSSSSTSSTGGCCSGDVTEEEEGGDDGCLDDWEAVADALAADEKREIVHHENSHIELIQQSGTNGPSESAAMNRPGSDGDHSKPESPRVVQRGNANCRAWKPDDALRPQSLPNLAKLHSFPTTNRQYDRGIASWACRKDLPVPSSCPICCEDLDFTDSSFLPCSCGFRLCLFCHKKLLEGDGRCPGCRTPYQQDLVEAETGIHGGSLTFRLARSFSMIARS